MTNIQSVLFDLDGTLIDTAPDMAHALNQLRLKHHLIELPLDAIRPLIGYGSKALLKLGFDVEDSDSRYPELLHDFFNLYQAHLANSTQLFPDMDNVLHFLEQQHIPWGIVTNKPFRFTIDILKALKLEQRAACVICGDTLTKRKPDPDSILHACELLQLDPRSCLYVGDTLVDVTASKAAGTKSLVALYGYIGAEEDPYAWHADGYINKPDDIINWIKPHLSSK